EGEAKASRYVSPINQLINAWKPYGAETIEVSNDMKWGRFAETSSDGKTIRVASWLVAKSDSAILNKLRTWILPIIIDQEIGRIRNAGTPSVISTPKIYLSRAYRAFEYTKLQSLLLNLFRKKEINLEGYMASIEGAGADLITYGPNILPYKYSHMEGGIHEYNSQPLRKQAKAVIGFLAENLPWDAASLEVMALGPGAGVELTEMNGIAKAQLGADSGKVRMRTVSLDPLSPTFQLKAGYKQIFSWIKEYNAQAEPGERIILEDPSFIPLEAAFALQSKGYDVFEVSDTPYIEHQYIMNFMDLELPDEMKFDFIYSHWGPLSIALSRDIEKRESTRGSQQVLDKMLPMLNDEGIAAISHATSDAEPVLEVLKDLKMPEGFISVVSAEKNLLNLLMVREDSEIGRRIRVYLESSECENMGERMYRFDDWASLFEFLEIPVTASTGTRGSSPSFLLQNLIVLIAGLLTTGLIANAVVPVLTGTVPYNMAILGFSIWLLPLMLPAAIVYGAEQLVGRTYDTKIQVITTNLLRGRWITADGRIVSLSDWFSNLVNKLIAWTSTKKESLSPEEKLIIASWEEVFEFPRFGRGLKEDALRKGLNNAIDNPLLAERAWQYLYFWCPYPDIVSLEKFRQAMLDSDTAHMAYDFYMAHRQILSEELLKGGIPAIDSSPHIASADKRIAAESRVFGDIDYSVQGTLHYVAAGKDWIRGILWARHLPNIDGITFSDWNYPVVPELGSMQQFQQLTGGLSIPLKRDKFAELMDEFKVKIENSGYGTIHEIKIDRTGIFATALLVMNDGRRIKIKLEQRDAMNYDSEPDEVITMIFRPGNNGTLSEEPGFWENICKKTGRYVIARFVESVDKLRTKEGGFKAIGIPSRVQESYGRGEDVKISMLETIVLERDEEAGAAGEDESRFRPYSLIQNLLMVVLGVVMSGLVLRAVIPVLTGAAALSLPLAGLAVVVLPVTLPVVIVLGGQLTATFVTRVIASIVFRGIEMPDGTIDLRKDEPLRSATLQ
ncbi:MAG: hypothetical protein JW871_06930, partial [Endomicrobiales bacterium]|nr:hypothetical protein [Endomicrobiales bacterium]